MKKVFLPTLLLVILAGAGCARKDQAPTPESIERLLDLTHAHSSYDSLISQLDMLETRLVDQSAMIKRLTPAQKADLAKQAHAIFSSMKAEFAWDQVKGSYIKIYSAAFTQEEVDDIVAFYESPAGEAMLNKLPDLLQTSWQGVQPRIGEAFQKAQRQIWDAATQMAPRPPPLAPRPAAPAPVHG
jgi:hypothetical protein